MISELEAMSLYERFAEAWKAKDVEKLMDLVTDDVVYGASIGPEPGTTYRGHEAVRQGFAKILAYDNATNTRSSSVTFVGGKLFAEWAYETPSRDGETGITRGIDILEFRDGRISLKEAFRKAPAQARETPRRHSPPVADQLKPYRPRRYGALGNWQMRGFDLKVYGISANTDERIVLITPQVVEAAEKYTRDRLSAAEREGGHHGLGYAILHEGADANWFILGWWVHAEIAAHLLSVASKEAPTAFAPVEPPILACVWELALIAHEREAWIRHMLTLAPDKAGYLSDRFAASII